MLQSAIAIRLLDDEDEAELEERDPFICGLLNEKDQEKALTLREACNKIIHANQINFDKKFRSEPTEEGAYYLPVAHLYGKKFNKSWKATIDLREFVNAGARMLRARSLQEYLENEHLHFGT